MIKSTRTKADEKRERFNRFNLNTPKWYVLAVREGKEVKVKQKILEIPKIEVSDFVIPEEKTLDLRKVNEKLYEELKEEMQIHKELFLGYFFIKLIMDNYAYAQILETENVFSFLGPRRPHKNNVTIPSCVTEEEMAIVKKYLTCTVEAKRIPKNEFRIDEEVMIISGHLTNIKGKIAEIVNGYAKIIPLAFFQKSIKVPISSIVKVSN